MGSVRPETSAFGVPDRLTTLELGYVGLREAELRDEVPLAEADPASRPRQTKASLTRRRELRVSPPQWDKQCWLAPAVPMASGVIDLPAVLATPPVFRPVMRVCLAERYTVRWRRGDTVAYVFAEREAAEGDGTVGVIATIPVSKTGWTDVAEVRAVATRWLRERARAA